MTTAWNISDMWQRLYNCISRANTALQLLNQLDENTYPLKQQRIAEMKFLRGHGHFLLKQLYKHIVLANDENLTPEEYNNLSNTTYTNDESWQQIANDFSSLMIICRIHKPIKGVLLEPQLQLIWQRLICIRPIVRIILKIMR